MIKEVLFSLCVIFVCTVTDRHLH